MFAGSTYREKTNFPTMIGSAPMSLTKLATIRQEGASSPHKNTPGGPPPTSMVTECSSSANGGIALTTLALGTSAAFSSPAEVFVPIRSPLKSGFSGLVQSQIILSCKDSYFLQCISGSGVGHGEH